MAFTARQLITRAYYLSGIVARDFESVTGQQINDGLDILNEILSEEGVTTRLIPYYKEYTFNAVPGQEKYFTPGLLQIETITFTIDSVRYQMRGQGRYQYFATGRANNIQSLPYSWHYERVYNGSDIYLYFLPDTDYPIQVWGKFALDEVATLDTDLTPTYERFYIKYLTYALSRDICEENQEAMPPQTMEQLGELEEKLTFVSPIDLTMRKVSSLQSKNVFNYGQANLGRGWYP